MSLVIDTSAIIAVISNEPERPLLLSATAGEELIAPISVHSEIGNALSAMLKRRRVTLEKCLTALLSYELIPLRFVDVDLAISLEISSELDIYAYDAYLIRCAERYRAPLLTLDRALIAKAKQYGLDVLEVSS